MTAKTSCDDHTVSPEGYVAWHEWGRADERNAQAEALRRMPYVGDLGSKGGAMTEHRPDVKGRQPLETWHITAECRENKTHYKAWEDAVHMLRHVYDAQVARDPEATISVAIFRTNPAEDSP